MRGQSSRLQRLASLSALTSAALAASTAAEAAIIYHPTPGLTVSGNGSASLGLPGGNRLSINGQTSARPLHLSTNDNRTLTIFGPHGLRRAFRSTVVSNGGAFGRIGAGGVSLRTTHGLLALGKKGQSFNQIGTGAGKGANVASQRSHVGKRVGRITYFYGPRNGSLFSRSYFSRKSTTARAGFRRRVSGHVTTNFAGTKVNGSRHSRTTSYSPSSYSKEYALFRFDDAGQTDYGWLELSLINGTANSPHPGHPRLRLWHHRGAHQSWRHTGTRASAAGARRRRVRCDRPAGVAVQAHMQASLKR